MDEKPVQIVDDPRPIRNVSWGELLGDGWWRIGQRYGDKLPDGSLQEITKIIAYKETGQYGYVPWVAVYVGDEIVVRADCTGAQIIYE